MAARPELIRICKELGIDYEELSIEGMRVAIQDEFDKWYDEGDYIGDTDVSDDLLKFITKEHNYCLRCKDMSYLTYDEILKRRLENEA